MAPLRKSAAQATAATSKSKCIVVGDLGPIDTHPPNLNVHIEDVREEHSSQATASKQGPTNKKLVFVEGQLLQMLAIL